MNLDNLTYYSQKLHKYIADKLTLIKDSVETLSKKIDNNKTDVDGKIQKNTDDIAQNVLDIQAVDNKVNDVDNKVDSNYNELKSDVTAADFRPTGDAIYLNNVEQFLFKDVVAGQTITIPNIGDGSDFMIQCYAQTEQGTPLQHKVININTTTKDLLEYDPRYVEITDAGAVPKSSISLQLQKQNTINGYNVYVTDYIPVELADNITALTGYGLILDETP